MVLSEAKNGRILPDIQAAVSKSPQMLKNSHVYTHHRPVGPAADRRDRELEVASGAAASWRKTLDAGRYSFALALRFR